MVKLIFLLLLALSICILSFANDTEIDTFMSYVKDTFSYETDWAQFKVDDYWQTPAEFSVTRKGDCEDFALFIARRLRRLGYRVQSYALQELIKGTTTPTGHVINVVWDLTNYKLYVTSNQQLIKVTDRKLLTAENVIKRLYQKNGIVLQEIHLITPNPTYGKQTYQTYKKNYTFIRSYYEL